MAEDFRLERLLNMDKAYFTARIRPHRFYMSDRYLWRWQMNEEILLALEGAA